jgi:hypothetical protein
LTRPLAVLVTNNDVIFNLPFIAQSARLFGTFHLHHDINSKQCIFTMSAFDGPYLDYVQACAFGSFPDSIIVQPILTDSKNAIWSE